ncbi:kynureninase [Ekhidna sp.]|uniref:kynureninase n=1 Tax=Ekhidna sp. TaxID=2608089 RepID=UPI003CCB9AFE
MKEEALQKAKQLDEQDQLSKFRSEFHFPQKDGKDCIYLCGNSLGLQPKRTSEFVNEELQKWKKWGVEGHFTGDKPWVSYHQNAKPYLSKIVGAHEHEVVAMNNLTTNLHLALASFYQPKGKRSKILIEKGAFPSDFYAVNSRIKVSGYDPEENLIELEPAVGSDNLSTQEIIRKIEELGDELALVMFPGIQYYTGQFFDINQIAAAAHKVGAYAGFDLAHAVGNVPLNLHEDKADFAVWCTYKYLNSGPGGVGGLFIHENHGKNKEMPRLSGWWGHNAEARFKMANQINPIPTVDGWQLSNVNILSHASHLASLSVFEEAGMENLRAKSLLLTDFMEELMLNSEVLNNQIKILTPTSHEERGAQLSIYLTNHGKSVFEYLIERGVILDWREPNVIRVAPVPLYNSFTDAVNFVKILEEAISNEG